MEAASAIGRFIRWSRENLGWTQQQLADKCGITYQYLSALENGKQNFTIGVLEALGHALGVPLPRLVLESYFGPESATPAPRSNPNYFRRSVPLPPGLTIEQLGRAMDETQRLVHLINAGLTVTGGELLSRYIQANNYSGIVSNILCDSLHRYSAYKHYSAQGFPDLMYRNKAGREVGGLEVKATTRPGKGGESHNGHSGWHLVAHFAADADTGDITFRHMMIADLNGHMQPDSDWKYQGSRVKAETGSQRTETYITTPAGTAKLRHGSVYLDPSINYLRWQRPPGGTIPTHSIFHPDNLPKKR